MRFQSDPSRSGSSYGAQSQSSEDGRDGKLVQQKGGPGEEGCNDRRFAESIRGGCVYSLDLFP